MAQARKILSDIKAEVQASNGAIVPKDTGVYTSSSSATLEDNGYTWDCNITRQSMLIDGAYEDGETFMYNNIYKISFKYEQRFHAIHPSQIQSVTRFLRHS